ncbi:hypothetical protein J6TS1_08590 [Siminovitchia terrae]|uniref:NlpC/P60 domain-containing protein n=1 Tax=Siminovitchia terrae TaxID=1914933 RepID=A0ABQ4KTL9_SIMTE|nr:hypothetical protein J6TS1_08590 [Siminovitchia terrae]
MTPSHFGIDLRVFDFAYKEGKGRVHHVGMYVGDEKMIHSQNTSPMFVLIPEAMVKNIQVHEDTLKSNIDKKTSIIHCTSMYNLT